MIATASEPEAQASVEGREVQVVVIDGRNDLEKAVVDPLVAHGGEQVRVLGSSDVQSPESVHTKADLAATPEVKAMASRAPSQERPVSVHRGMLVVAPHCGTLRLSIS